MSIFTTLAQKGSKTGNTNVEHMLKEEDNDLLVQIPRSKYMLKCKDNDNGTWEINIINPYSIDKVLVHESLETFNFQSLLFNIFSINIEGDQYEAVKDLY